MSDNPSITPFPHAMKPPEGEVTIINTDLINSAIDMSRKSPRGRIIYPFHKSNNDNIHRMLNVIQPYSYIQPHRHSSPPKPETVIVLKGTLAFITYSENGEINETTILSNQSDKIGIDTGPNIFHTFFALEKDTVIFETKPGPYVKISEKDNAKWAPQENDNNCKEYLEKLYKHVNKA